jgi:hypothetical protein
VAQLCDAFILPALFARKANDADALKLNLWRPAIFDHPQPRRVFSGRTSWRLHDAKTSKTSRRLLLAGLIASLIAVPAIVKAQVLFLAQRPGAAQAAAFLARTSGLSGTETTVYNNLFSCLSGNNAQAQNVLPLLDAYYFFATNTSATASLNLISRNYTITPVGGTPIFTADVGFTTSGRVVLIWARATERTKPFWPPISVYRPE